MFRCWLPPYFPPNTTTSLTINKISQGGDGVFNFTLLYPNGILDAFNLATTDGIGTKYIVNLEAGTYILTELDQPGWITLPAQTLNLVAGVPTNITLTNIQTASLIINKESIGADGIFNFTLTAPDTTSTNISITTINEFGNIYFQNLQAGTYTITEIAQTGWVTLPPQNIIINNGQLNIITLTNVQSGDLTINKSNQDSTDGNFTFDIDPAVFGIGSFVINTAGGTGSYNFPDIPAGNYTITEHVPFAPWAQHPPVTTIITDGQSQTVTINNLKGGTLVVTKDAGNNNGSFDFTISPAINGMTAFNMETLGSPSQNFINSIYPGTYTISEVPQTGWTASNPIQNVTITNGNTSNLTFTNTPT